MIGYYKKYFKNVISKKEIIDNKQLEIDKFYSTKFSFFDYLYFGENNLSDIFRDLLDMDGNHGQKGVFFNLFLKIIFTNDLQISQKIEKFKYFKPVIKREVYTDRIHNSHRRIDIVIEWNNDFAIGIENKPFDRDQDNQLLDYAEHLKAKYADFCLVYLAEKEVTEKSILKNKLEELKLENKFKHINYSEDINHWLSNCANECQSPKIVFFLEDLKNKLKNHFVGMEVNNENEIVQYTISEDENIKAIFDIYRNYDNVLKAVAKKFTQELMLKFSDKVFEFQDKTIGSLINIQVRKEYWKPEIWCCVSTEYHDNIFLGIWDENNILTSEHIVKELLKSKSILEIKKESNWIWWSFPQSQYQKWQESPDKIIAMNNGKSADYYYNELLLLIRILDENLKIVSELS